MVSVGNYIYLFWIFKKQINKLWKRIFVPSIHSKTLFAYDEVWHFWDDPIGKQLYEMINVVPILSNNKQWT